MNKFKPLFDIPLAKYNTLNEYPPSDKVKQALEAYFINHTDIPKKPTVEKLMLSFTDSASVNVNVAQTNNKKRKRGEQSDKDESKSLSPETPSCLHCDKRHDGDC
jgi:hypothetical protein